MWNYILLCIDFLLSLVCFYTYMHVEHTMKILKNLFTESTLIIFNKTKSTTRLGCVVQVVELSSIFLGKRNINFQKILQYKTCRILNFNYEKTNKLHIFITGIFVNVYLCNLHIQIERTYKDLKLILSIVIFYFGCNFIKWQSIFL